MLLGTSWGKTWELGEPCGNKSRTRKKQKIFIPLPKEKIWTYHEGMLNLFIGYMKLLFSKLLVTIYSLG
jgi:hypothetical protein